MSQNQEYQLIDSGEGAKLERFGPYTLSRPCAQAVWKKSMPDTIWQAADATFTRIDDKRWTSSGDLPRSWEMVTEGIRFKISPTDFGHLGIFAEQKSLWHSMRKRVQDAIQKEKRPIRALNLFAYSGGATLALAQGGAEVCHLDASKGMVTWARENAAINQLEKAPIRWIIEDVQKFIEREIRRQSFYDVIVLDPPTFGRGAQGELFKIEEHIIPLLGACKRVLTANPLFILFSCHTPGFTPTVLEHLLRQNFGKGTISKGEMLLGEQEQRQTQEHVFSIPSGSYAYLDF
jgi:23S rRNA (cytosine1962-C5)-methyltransferase